MAKTCSPYASSGLSQSRTASARCALYMSTNCSGPPSTDTAPTPWLTSVTPKNAIRVPTNRTRAMSPVMLLYELVPSPSSAALASVSACDQLPW